MNWWLAKEGLKHDPEIEYRFKPDFLIETRHDWEEKVRSVIRDADRLYDEAYPDADNGGNVGPIGSVIIVISGPYLFLYSVDAYGHWNREAFTHHVIAGDMQEFLDRIAFKTIQEMKEET